MYANTSNRMEIPVIDPIGVSYQNQFLGQNGQTIVNGAGIGLMEPSSPISAAPTGQSLADISNRKAMNRNWLNQNANPALKPKREINKYFK